MEPDSYQEIVTILAGLPTARSRMFFASHGLGPAFDRPGKGWGRMQRVNEALAEANQQGILESVLQDARRQFTPPPSPLGEQDATRGPKAGTAWTADLTAPLGDPGGFGQVYAGYGPDSTEVAIKVVPLRHGDEAERRRRAREIEIAARLAERSAAHLLVPIDHALDGEDLLIVMPRAKASLRDQIQAGLDDQAHRAALLDVALGLQELAVAGVLHRDLKPRNVLWRNGVWQLADFGISRDLAQGTATYTFRGFGSPAYMAPELWQLQPATVKTDLYAYGCLAWEVLTGEPPFPGPDLEPGLARLVLRLMDKDPARRPQDARAVAEELQRLGAPLAEQQERLRRRALAADQEQAAREAAYREGLAQLSSADARRQQARSDLEMVIESARDFVQEALPDIRLNDDGAQWHLRLGRARLTFVPWPWHQTLEPGNDTDDLVLAGEVHAASGIGANLGIVANIVCEERAGRLEWQLYRFTASPLVGPNYELGPRDRQHGFPISSFTQERVYMIHPAMHVWQLQRDPLSAEIIAALFEDLL